MSSPVNHPATSRSQVLRNERLLHFGMVTLAVLFIGATYSMRCTIAQNVQLIALDIKDCETIQDLETELTNSITELELKKQKVEEKYSALMGRIPKKIADSDVLSSVRRSVQSARCSLIDFRPTITQQNREYHTRSYDLQLEGSFKSIFQFFDILQEAPLNFQTSRLKISEPSTPGGPCHLDLELKVIFDHSWTPSA
jgi:Tfp pilus assembly protein PilO